MKKITLYFLSLIGVISILISLKIIYTHENEARKYLIKCSQVEVGMTLEEAKKIMGEANTFYSKNKSKISYFKNGKNIKYYLHYTVVFFSSYRNIYLFQPKHTNSYKSSMWQIIEN